MSDRIGRFDVLSQGGRRADFVNEGVAETAKGAGRLAAMR